MGPVFSYLFPVNQLVTTNKGPEIIDIRNPKFRFAGPGDSLLCSDKFEVVSQSLSFCHDCKLFKVGGGHLIQHYVLVNDLSLKFGEKALGMPY